MTYPDLFKSRYPSLQGKAWIQGIHPEDRKVFSDIGLLHADHGRQGGKALVKRRGREHMQKIARIGAIMSNIRQEWARKVQEESCAITNEF